VKIIFIDKTLEMKNLTKILTGNFQKKRLFGSPVRKRDGVKMDLVNRCGGMDQTDLGLEHVPADCSCVTVTYHPPPYRRLLKRVRIL